MLVGDWIMVGMGISVLLSIVLGFIHDKGWFSFGGFVAFSLLISFLVTVIVPTDFLTYYATDLTLGQRCTIEETNSSQWIHYVQIDLEDNSGCNNVYKILFKTKYHDHDEANKVVSELPFKLYKSKKDVPNIQECD